MLAVRQTECGRMNTAISVEAYCDVGDWHSLPSGRPSLWRVLTIGSYGEGTAEAESCEDCSSQRGNSPFTETKSTGKNAERIFCFTRSVRIQTRSHTHHTDYWRSFGRENSDFNFSFWQCWPTEHLWRCFDFSTGWSELPYQHSAHGREARGCGGPPELAMDSFG